MYDDLPAHFHLMFENWDASIARQAAALGPLLERECGRSPLDILDAACGIGTQAIGLALRGHHVTGSDLSALAAARAKVEAAARNLEIPTYAADLRDLSAVPGSPFDAVIAADNSIAHLLSPEDLRQAFASAGRVLRPGGVLLVTVRDYDRLVIERPAFQGPAFCDDVGRRRIVYQVWDWTGERTYTMHLYITRQDESGWTCLHFTSPFYAVGRAAIESALAASGLGNVQWLDPSESGYYQPVILARRAE